MIKYLIKKSEKSDSKMYLTLLTEGAAVLKHLFSLLVFLFQRKLERQTTGIIRNRYSSHWGEIRQKPG